MLGALSVLGASSDSILARLDSNRENTVVNKKHAAVSALLYISVFSSKYVEGLYPLQPLRAFFYDALRFDPENE